MESSREPVDLKQLEDSASGESEIIIELIELYLQQMKEELLLLDQAVASAVAVDIQKIAHKCKGSSASCGANRLAESLRQLEEMGKNQQVNGASEVFSKAKQEFEEVNGFFTEHLRTLKK
jgi:HPt (histidine-containing phosphotransfer) domain-containing protein